MNERIRDYLILGAGPAGLQVATDLAAAGRDYLVLEAGEAPGTFFRTFPRHRTLISNNKRHTGSSDPEFNLRMDWNSLLTPEPDPDLLFTRYSERYFPAADDLVRYLADFAEAMRLDIRYRVRAQRVCRADGLFEVTDTDGGRWRARRLVVATGFGAPHVPDVPGIEHAEQYATMSTAPDDFTDQRVLILGKGNSAMETADNLVETAAVIHVAGPHSLRLAWQSHFVGHLRAVNNNFLDTYQLKSQNAILDGSVLDITTAREGGYLVRFAFARAEEVVKELRYDRVLCCTGFRFDSSVFAEECRPELTISDRFPKMTAGFESVNVPGIYFAGTLTQQRDFKRSTNGFIHGFRYGARALTRILAERHHDTPWPASELPSEPSELAWHLLRRLNRTSALWQQFGEIGDVLTVEPGGPARLHLEVPVRYVPDSDFARAAALFVITLEYGPDHDKVDPFDITVRRVGQNDAANAFDASYLHPVIRHYRTGAYVAEHHVAENLENEWDRPDTHHAPFASFLSEALDTVVVS